MTPTDDISQPLGPQDSPLTWRDQSDLSRVSASVRASLVKFDQRPNPPRGLKFSGGIIQWEAPQYSEQVTHYRVYAPTEATLVREVPVGQLMVDDNLSADRVFVSAFNRNSGLESIKVLLDTRIAPAAIEGLVLFSGKRVFDAAITSGLTALSSATAAFTVADIGKIAYVQGAGVAGADLVTTIAAYTSASIVQLTAAASTTVTGKELRFGLDNKAAFDAAINSICVTRKNGGKLIVPKGLYLTSGTINVLSHVRIEGECYVNTSVLGSAPVEPPSFILCVNPVPVFATSGAPCYSPAFSRLGISGVPTAGSKGIYGSTVWNCFIEDCFFEDFGDQAIHLEKFDFTGTASVTAVIRNNFAQNCCRVHARADYVGVFDLGPTDCFISDNNINASMDAFGIVSNKIAALAMRGPQSFVGPNQCGHSEIGVYVDPACSETTFVNTRADNNQGRGWVIAGSSNGFIGVRCHANSQASDGTYNAYEVSGAGNTFTSPRISWNGLGFGALSYRVNNAFVTTNNNTTEPNYLLDAHIQDGSYLGAQYLTSGTQISPIADFTAFDPIGRRSFRIQNCDLSIRNYDMLMVQTAGPANEKVWRKRLNYGGGFSQLLDSVMTDAYGGEVIYLRVDRTGTTINFVDVVNGIFRALGGARVTGDVEITGGEIIFQASTVSIRRGNGSPETVVTAVGGSIYLDYGGSKLWLKTSGAGNTGWTEVFAGSSALPVVDTTAIVKGSGDATKLVRIEADGLTTATTRVMAMPDRDITLNQLSNLTADSSALLTCANGVYNDVVGATVTLTLTGWYLILGSFVMAVDQPANAVQGRLVVNGVAQTGIVECLLATLTATDSIRGSHSRQWMYNNSGSNVAKLQAQKIAAGGTGQVQTPGTNITAIFLG